MKAKKILSLLVAMAVLFSSVGIAAMAENASTWDQFLDSLENGDGSITLDDDIIIGEESVATYDELVAALSEGKPVKLTADIIAPDSAVLTISNQVVNLGGESIWYIICAECIECCYVCGKVSLFKALVWTEVS